ncbi:MAG: hypothetical protein R2875_09300 [Desulfobacterales bacterium]
MRLPFNRRRSRRQPLAEQVAGIAETCINCPKCMSECEFLKQNGTPKFIAEHYHPMILTGWHQHLPAVCAACAVVCPVAKPANMFIEMRREAVDRGAAPLPAHKGIMAYEQRGISERYSWYSLPEGCDTVLFPGCTFAGTRMDTTIALIIT